MSKHKRIILAIAVLLAFILPLGYGYLSTHNVAVLNPKGLVAVEQKELLITTVLLGLIVIIPVYAMLVIFAVRYRAGNSKHVKYSPELSGNVWAELVWWGIPLAIISILSVITWNSSHSLDPRRPLTNTKPLKVQVVALEWKWLFIYPEQKVASVNYLALPAGREVAFDITADAPMNSFWIPQLGSQMYAMPGMSTKLHLVANEPGDYRGSSANISGEGFADMHFTARADSQERFNEFIRQASLSTTQLDLETYRWIAKPSKDYGVLLLSQADPKLYHEILMKYQTPGGINYAR